jgi:hypothetical protein
MSGFSFAGLSPAEIAGVGNDLDLIQRMAAVWVGFCDIPRVEANVRLLREQQQASLQAMRDAAAAEAKLSEAKTAQERQAAELTAREQALEERELRLNQREAQIGEREQQWAAVTAQVRGVAA